MNDRYTSDLTDEQWDLIRQFLPTEQDGPGRPMELQPREVVNAILYVVRTGCQWDNLPNDLPNANSVYYHYRKWCLDGTWRQVNQALREEERTDRGRDPEPTGGIIDSQSVETTESGSERIWGRAGLRCWQRRLGTQATRDCRYSRKRTRRGLSCCRHLGPGRCPAAFQAALGGNAGQDPENLGRWGLQR